MNHNRNNTTDPLNYHYTSGITIDDLYYMQLALQEDVYKMNTDMCSNMNLISKYQSLHSKQLELLERKIDLLERQLDKKNKEAALNKKRYSRRERSKTYDPYPPTDAYEMVFFNDPITNKPPTSGNSNSAGGGLLSFLNLLNNKLDETETKTKEPKEEEEEVPQIEYNSDDEFEEYDLKINNIKDLINATDIVKEKEEKEEDNDKESDSDEPPCDDDPLPPLPPLISGKKKSSPRKYSSYKYTDAKETTQETNQKTYTNDDKTSKYGVFNKSFDSSKKDVFNFSCNPKSKPAEKVKSTKQYSIDPKLLAKIQKPLQKFDKMIGLKDFKSAVTEMVMYQLQYRKKGDMLHTVIEGPPGVGKTEIGKILAEVYANMGIIRENKINIVKRADLIAEYLGQTAPKTQKAIDEALGGVLFIDEAYSLGSDEKTDIYSKECIDTLNQNLSDNKKDFICIIAGYPDQLENCFFAKNPGLKRRFPFTFRIDGYDYKELCGIFLKKLEDSKWKIDGELDVDELEKFFKEHKDDFPHYGGDIENLVVSCQICQSQRIFGKHPKNRYKLTKDDITNGLERFKKSKKKGKDNTIPFGMYC